MYKGSHQATLDSPVSVLTCKLSLGVGFALIFCLTVLTLASELSSLQTNDVGDGRCGSPGIRVVSDFAGLYYSLSRRLRCYLELPLRGRSLIMRWSE